MCAETLCFRTSVFSRSVVFKSRLYPTPAILAQISLQAEFNKVVPNKPSITKVLRSDHLLTELNKYTPVYIKMKN